MLGKSSLVRRLCTDHIPRSLARHKKIPPVKLRTSLSCIQLAFKHHFTSVIRHATRLDQEDPLTAFELSPLPPLTFG